MDKTVLFVSSSFPQSSKDWKSVFVHQLLTALSESSFGRLSYWGPPGTLPSGVESLCLSQETKWLAELMNQGGIIHLLRQGGLSRFTFPPRLLYYLKRMYSRTSEIDLYHINWLQNAIPLLGSKKPVVISVLGSDLGILRIPGMISIIRLVLKNRSSVLAPNAEWMVEILEKNFGDLCKVVCVPLGIDDSWYKVEREREHNCLLKWLVISRLTKKKIGTLFDWGRDLFAEGSNNELNLFGPMQEQIYIPDWVHYHGPTFPEELRVKWFPRAAGLITLSQHDEGRPQVMLEAMAAGIPVIASDLPAHRNFINHKKTGWLASSRSGFKEGLQFLSSHAGNSAIGNNGRAWVRMEIGTWADCASRYVKVYKMVMEID